MADIARKHHTVPQFYLRGFATEDRQIGTVQLPGSRRFVQSTRAASTRTDFYALPGHEDGQDVFEKGLSRMEGDAAAVIRKITDKGVWPLSSDDREVLAIFLTVQFLRGPDQRRHMEQMMALMTRMEIGYGGKANVANWVKRKHGLTVSEEQAARIWEQATQPDGPPIQLAPVGHINQLLDLTPRLVRYFAFRPWLLFRFSSRSLLTCDVPVSLVPHLSQQEDDAFRPDEGSGLITAWGITFPLTRKIGLLLASPDELIGHVTANEVATGRFDLAPAPSTTVANVFNASTIGNSRQWIFHHPDDKHLVPDKLPEPRFREVEVLGGPQEFSGEALFGSQPAAVRTDTAEANQPKIS